MNADELYAEFTKSYKIICDKFAIEQELLKVRRLETKEVGLDYYVTGETKEFYINFGIRSYSNNADVTGDSLTVSLTIESPKLFRPKYFRREFDRSQYKKGFLQRWGHAKIRQFSRWLDSEPLDVIFHDMDIRVYGMPGYTRPTIAEFVTVLAGLEKRQRPKELLVYRFHHKESYDDEAEFFSYAFWISVTDYDFWIVFPNAAGLRGGENFRDYCFIEDSLKNASVKLKPDIRDFDIDYDEFEDYLLQHALTFGSSKDEVQHLKTILKIISDEIYFVLIVEGDDDEAVWRSLIKKSKINLDRVVITKYGEGGKDEAIKAAKLFRHKRIRRIPHKLILDSDNDREAAITKLKQAQIEHFHVLQKQEIESYLLDATAIARVLNEKPQSVQKMIGKVKGRDGKEKLDKVFIEFQGKKATSDVKGLVARALPVIPAELKLILSEIRRTIRVFSMDE